jgi:hypothetical protein
MLYNSTIKCNLYGLACLTRTQIIKGSNSTRLKSSLLLATVSMLQITLVIVVVVVIIIIIIITTTTTNSWQIDGTHDGFRNFNAPKKKRTIISFTVCITTLYQLQRYLY